MSTYSKDRFPIRSLKAALFSLILPTCFIFAPVTPGNSLDPSGPAAGFQVALVDKMADFPVQWVAAGGGVLAYGAGQHVDFSPVKEPFSPISHLSFEGVISGGLIIGKYAYLSQEGLGLRIIDLDVSSGPVDMGFYPLSGSTFRLANWGNLIFVGGTSDGVQIFELSSDQHNMMAQPRVTLVDQGIIPVEESITAIAADQGKLYVATAGKKIRIYDISDPSLILEMESLPVTLPVRSIAIDGGHLYVAAGTDGLLILDLSAPGKAETVATYPVPSESLYPAGRLVYLATGSNGLHLLKAGPIGTATFNAQVAPGGSFSFSPDPININTGDTVKWTWEGGPHSTTSGPSCPTFDGPGPNSWDSGLSNPPATFSFTFNTPGSFPYFCSLHCFTGTVIVASAGPAINISINPATIDFGNVNVGQFSDQTITITNQASSNATLAGSVGALSASFSVQSGGGAFSLTPGQSVTVTVRFSPAAEGAAATNLSIIHNATNQTNPASIPLIGTGVTPGIHISVNPASLNFGNVTVGQSTSRNITILNQANSTGPLTGSVGAPTGPFSIVSGGGPFNLPPGQSQIVTVSFSPAVSGASSDILFITHNATEQTNPINIPLSGAGMTTPLPDLIVSFISGPHLSKPGGRIAISNTIMNQGTQAAANILVNFYLSTDQQITTSDIFLGKRSIKALAAGASSGPMSTNVTIPSSLTTGSYFIGAIVDPTNVIVESNEGNNTASDPAGINVCVSLAKPKLLSPKNRGTNISTTPTLIWAAVNGASTYEVQVATDSAFTNVVVSTTGLTNPQWAVTQALNSGTTYSWRARAVNLCGPGPFSATSSFKTAP
jgi:hypothetical protein